MTTLDMETWNKALDHMAEFAARFPCEDTYFWRTEMSAFILSLKDKLPSDITFEDAKIPELRCVGCPERCCVAD